ncbi:MAG: hypothetical protein WB297_14665 [Actinomycetota bacterium]
MEEEAIGVSTEFGERVTVGSRPESLAGQGWLGKVLLSFSVLGVPLVLFVLRRFGRWGGLLVEAGCGVLFVRDVTMTATGAPAKLRPLPRLLLFVEVAASGVATFAGLWAWVWRPFIGRPPGEDGTGGRSLEAGVRKTNQGTAMPSGQAAVRVATAAAASTFVLHTAREAIYLSPGHGQK